VDIFVFGSNLAGRHGRGSAKEALLRHGAVYGKGEGLQGRSYAIPTKDENLRTLPIPTIHYHVRKFVRFAEDHPEMTFHVVKVGCGLAGIDEDIMRSMFLECPANCRLPEGWRE
jgi:hypothetical protein